MVPAQQVNPNIIFLAESQHERQAKYSHTRAATGGGLPEENEGNCSVQARATKNEGEGAGTPHDREKQNTFCCFHPGCSCSRSCG